MSDCLVINWGQVCEIEILRMIDEYYTKQDYTVEWTHGRSELGADLICSKEDETIVVFGKRNPGQSDLGQVSVAKRNYPDVNYEYFYVGKPSGNFLSVMRNDHSDVHRNNEESTERLMFESNNVNIFRFLVKYSKPIVRLARIIKRIFTIGPNETTEEFNPTSAIHSTLLDFHEGVLQTREILKSAIADGRRLLDFYPEYESDEVQRRQLATKALEVFQSYLERLETSTQKMFRLMNLGENFLLRKLYGREVWGTTITGLFARTDLDQGDLRLFSNSPDRRHLLKILHHLTSWCEPQLYGVLETIGCFLSVEEYFRFLKKGSENLMRTVFEMALNIELRASEEPEVDLTRQINPTN